MDILIMRSFKSSLPLFACTIVAPCTYAQSSETSPFKVDTTLKLETFDLRNENLRKGEKNENTFEIEPLVRLKIKAFEDRPIYGVAELEFTHKTKRESAKEPEKNKKLDLTQAYIGFDIDALDTDIRVGRWLYRDEREWLFDENMDGALIRWGSNNWQAELLAGRVNYWQRDLLDSTTRNDKETGSVATFLRYKLDKKWKAGIYAAKSHETAEENEHLTHFGLRSYDTSKKGISHWAELGFVNWKDNEQSYSGTAVDVGATVHFKGNIKPRLTLGYAYSSEHYRQTGLHSNEATYGGNTKFNIYGATLAPELRNLQVITAGVGMNITDNSSIDLVYHYYTQSKLADLEDNNTELKSRYDDRQTKRLGSGVDLIWGLEVRDNIKTELILGMFSPSKRFRSSSSDDAPRSSPAYSIGTEVEIKF